MEIINENMENYLTLAGFIIFFLGHIPPVGEKLLFVAISRISRFGIIEHELIL